MNTELANIFYEIANILEMKNAKWEPIAYRKAARALESLGEDVSELYEKQGANGLKEIPGVGEAIAKKIIEYIETGKIKHLEELKKTLPKGLPELLKVSGIGAKKAMKLYHELGISSVKELEKAAKKHKIQGVETFKEKSEENILKGIELMKASKGRTLLGKALPIARVIEVKLKSLKEVEEAISAGSLRRKEETIGDIDILVVSEDNQKVVEFFTNLAMVKRVLAKGETKAAIITKDNMQVDIRIIEPDCFGSALQYFIGNKEHNIHLRKIAIKKGLKLSEYGLFRGKNRIAGKNEEEIYKKLGMQYPEPELRTERGEIEAALKNKLPKLVGYNELLGDLHVHTDWSDGGNSTQEMAEAAKENGLKYIAITDHGGKMKIDNALDEKRLEKQIKEIEKVNEKIQGIEILKGIEVDINSDGSLALSDSVLKKLDVVIASVHSGFKFPEDKQTARVLKAMDNPYVNILGHPTGRLIQRRNPLNLNLEKVYEKAKGKNIALEINASPDRLDLNDAEVRKAIEKGVKITIGTDAHSISQLNYLELGTAVARRGWATKKDVLNCLEVEKLKKALKK